VIRRVLRGTLVGAGRRTLAVVRGTRFHAVVDVLRTTVRARDVDRLRIAPLGRIQTLPGARKIRAAILPRRAQVVARLAESINRTDTAVAAAPAGGTAPARVGATFPVAAFRVAAGIVYAFFRPFACAAEFCRPDAQTAVAGAGRASLVHDVRAVFDVRIALFAEAVHAFAGGDRTEMVPAVDPGAAFAACAAAAVITTLIDIARPAVRAAAETSRSADCRSDRLAGTEGAAVTAQTVRPAFASGTGCRTALRPAETAHVVTFATGTARAAASVIAAYLAAAVGRAADAFITYLVAVAGAAVHAADARSAPPALAAVGPALADFAELTVAALAARPAAAVVAAVLPVARLLAALPFLAPETGAAGPASVRTAATVLAAGRVAAHRDTALARVAWQIVVTRPADAATTVIAAFLSVAVRHAADTLETGLQFRTVAA